MEAIRLTTLIVLFFCIKVNSQIDKKALKGEWKAISEEINEMKEESKTLDGSLIKADMIIRFKEESMLDVVENGVKYESLEYKFIKKKDDSMYLLFGNREYLVSELTDKTLVLVKSNTVLPMKTTFSKTKLK